MEEFVPISIFLAILIAILFIGRGISLWYWKINERLEIEKENHLLLKRLVEKAYELPKGSLENTYNLSQLHKNSNSESTIFSGNK